MAVAATAPEQLWFLNSLVTVRVSNEAGGDGVSVLESLAPQGTSPPLHVHQTEDEIFHVLEGQVRFRAGAADVTIGAGETLLGPKGVPHTYRVESPAGARWLVITTHGDFERFVRTVARRAERPDLPAAAPPTQEQADALAAAARQHRIEFVGPPLDA